MYNCTSEKRFYEQLLVNAITKNRLLQIVTPSEAAAMCLLRKHNNTRPNVDANLFLERYNEVIYCRLGLTDETDH